LPLNYQNTPYTKVAQKSQIVTVYMYKNPGDSVPTWYKFNILKAHLPKNRLDTGIALYVLTSASNVVNVNQV